MSAATLFLWTSEWLRAPRPAPPERRLFAIGDLHGCSDLLRALQRVIRERIEAAGGAATVVCLGDYVDRGPRSSSTIDLVEAGLGASGVREVALVGNHDLMLRELLEEEDPGWGLVDDWLRMSAIWTLIDLGLDVSIVTDPSRRFRERVAAALGERRIAFLRRLRLAHREGDYLFVHAGVDPRGGEEETRLATLVEIREPFLSWRGPWPHPFVVVHGHTPHQPAILPHRIGVDTGAPFTGALTAVEIAGDRARFLTVANTDDEGWRDSLPGDREAVRYRRPERLPS